MSDPQIEPRWIKVHSIMDGWITLRVDHISQIHPLPNGFAVRMVSGSLILLKKKEGQRIFHRILPEGIRP